VKKRSK